MAMTRIITRLLLATTTTTTSKLISGPAFRRSYTSLLLATSRSPPIPAKFPLLGLRYLTAASPRLLTPAHSTAVRAFATRQTSSSLNDPIQNLSNQPPEETIPEDYGRDGDRPWIIVTDEPEGNPTTREIIHSYVKTLAAVVGSLQEARMRIYIVSPRHYFAFGASISKEIAGKIRELPRVRSVVPDTGGGFLEHWLILCHTPKGNPTRDEIIDSYIKALAAVVGSEEEARKKIYLVSTKHYFAFAAVISEEIADKIRFEPEVRMVGTDASLGVIYCGGEPFINGQAVPYDPKYHEEWFRMKALLEQEEQEEIRNERLNRAREERVRRRNNRNGEPHNFRPLRNVKPRRRPNGTNVSKISWGGNKPGRPSLA